MASPLIQLSEYRRPAVLASKRRIDIGIHGADFHLVSAFADVPKPTALHRVDCLRLRPELECDFSVFSLTLVVGAYGMNRKWMALLAKLTLGAACLLMFSAASTGCSQNQRCRSSSGCPKCKCKDCPKTPCGKKEAENCQPNCDKPRCKKAEAVGKHGCPPGCTKPCCKKASAEINKRYRPDRTSALDTQS